jgi:hypothetical protein
VQPSSLFKFGKLKLNRAGGTANLTVAVPGPGTLVLAGWGIQKVKQAAKGAGNVTLAIKLVGKAKRKLDEAGKAKMRAKLTFTADGGSPLTKTRALTLKEMLGRSTQSGRGR